MSTWSDFHISKMSMMTSDFGRIALQLDLPPPVDCVQAISHLLILAPQLMIHLQLIYESMS